MDSNQIKELKRLIDKVVHAPTKKEARILIKELEFMESNLQNEIENPYLLGKLSEAINFAKEASGQSGEKQHWISCMERTWYVFESRISSD